MRNSERTCHLLLFMCVSMAALCLYSYETHGQIPDLDRATREVDRPIREEAEERLRGPALEPVEEPDEDLPEIEDIEEKFFVKEIRVSGNENFPDEELRPIIEPFEGKELSFQRLRALTRRIERAYLQRGMVAACLIPPQDIDRQGGVIFLRIIESRMGELTISDARWFDKERIEYYWPMKSGDLLRYDKLSKALDFMNRNPDRHVKASLTAGRELGTSDIILDVATRFPVHTFFTFDREGATSTGHDRLGFGVRHNNFLRVDDTLLLGHNTGRSFWGWYAYHTVPVTPHGGRIMYGYSKSRSKPLKEFEPFGIKSTSESASLFYYQDLYKDITRIGEIGIGIDGTNRTVQATAGTINRDRLRVLRGKGTYIHRYPGNITYIRPEISQGLNWLGAKRRDHLSSRDASNTFLRFRFDIDHTKLLPLDLKANWKFRSQLAGQRLPSSEQFFIGGINSVRGYPSQDFSADHGMQHNLELILPAKFIPENYQLPFEFKPLRESVEGVLFFDQAVGRIRGPTGRDTPRTAHYASAGAGVRFSLYDQASLRLEWGFPLGDSSLSESGDSRFHIYLNFEDRLPEQIEHINQVLRERHIERSAWQLLEEELAKQSPALLDKINDLMIKANEAYEEGALDRAKIFYAEAQHIISSLFKQVEEQLAMYYAIQDRMRAKYRIARQEFTNKNYHEAKRLFQEIASLAELEPIKVEYNL